ncbi:hypothetical protein Nepgr_020695 [Nepenthes gracilis]|uniref:MATH domain-containing protein n=1 Tax=Nepenthes gracilis TaxID=150966 RepID=A0AAD3XWB8_NEPGR|nr:hypothetical protein Nepgr_020695 [Nepenthes gracilis]
MRSDHGSKRRPTWCAKKNVLTNEKTSRESSIIHMKLWNEREFVQVYQSDACALAEEKFPTLKRISSVSGLRPLQHLPNCGQRVLLLFLHYGRSEKVVEERVLGWDMAGIVSDESSVGRSLEGISSRQRCQSGEALAEWRSCEQLENGAPSTPPPYWDSDNSDDEGPKPSELYGRYTWKIEKFSQINKRELRSNAFEVGGYKWYILIYPQGCEVCNHLSLFLCVADHDKLLPGWSHFAQFTIAVVNKDPKKSKHSDTLHRFGKKEHDWGWKKFMELSKVSDGFVDDDTLIIKAQVQVIREKADRPFRCLDCQYRRELVRVYLTNVEQICRRFVEDRRGKLGKLLEDKARWSSFCSFWLGMDQHSRRCMSREKMDMILKVIVKQFFIEKEVTSTLVMDSLYSGLKALEGQNKCKKVKEKLLDGERTLAPIIWVEDDMFVLVDDVLLLLERAAMEPLPPKDEKGPQNRTKDGGAGEDFTKDTVERDERRLTELGRRTVEIFVLAHIFCNKIEAAYQEAVALKRQEELIREEEAAWLAESDQKGKRGMVEKEKKSKKKQGKQKRNNSKVKVKAKDDKTCVAVQDKNPIDDGKALLERQTTLEKDDVEDVSDVSDSVDFATDVFQPDSEERETSPVNWDTDTSEVHLAAEASGSGVGSSILTAQNGIDKRTSSVMDDSSSACSTDSAPSMAVNGSCRGNSLTNKKSQKSPTRGKNQRSKVTSEEIKGISEADSQSSEPVADRHHNDVSPSGKAAESNESASAVSLQDRIKGPEQNMVKKEEEVMLLQRMPGNKDTGLSKEWASVFPYSPKSPPRNNTVSAAPLKLDTRNGSVDVLPVKKAPSNSLSQTNNSASLTNTRQTMSGSRADPIKAAGTKPAERLSGQQTPMTSRPSSAPLIPGSPPSNPTVPIIQAASAAPLLSRSISAAGRLSPDPSPANHSYVPQSYRNAIIGSSVAASVVNPSPNFSQQPALMSAPVFLPQIPKTTDKCSVSSGISFELGTQESMPSARCWMASPQRNMSRSMTFGSSSMLKEVQNPDLYLPVHSGSHASFLSSDCLVSSPSRHTRGVLADEFPHLDIINDLLNDEQPGGGSTIMETRVVRGPSTGLHRLDQHLTLPSEAGPSASSCRIERSQSYHYNGYQRDSLTGSHFDSSREYIPRATQMQYANGHIDGLVPNQWQVSGPDLSIVNMRNAGGNGYPFNFDDYSNLSCGMNGYAMFRPSNGH